MQKRFSFPCTLQTRRERDGSQITHIKCEAANGVVRAENTGLCLTEESAEASLTECRWPLAEACGGGSVCGKRISGVVKGVCKALGLWGVNGQEQGRDSRRLAGWRGEWEVGSRGAGKRGLWGRKTAV